MASTWVNVTSLPGFSLAPREIDDENGITACEYHVDPDGAIVITSVDGSTYFTVAPFVYSFTGDGTTIVPSAQHVMLSEYSISGDADIEIGYVAMMYPSCDDYRHVADDAGFVDVCATERDFRFNVYKDPAPPETWSTNLKLYIEVFVDSGDPEGPGDGGGYKFWARNVRCTEYLS